MITPLAKPEPLARVRARRKRQAAKARLACVLAVWDRAGARCEAPGCGRRLEMGSAFAEAVGYVHEVVHRSQGGDPTDPAACRLLCPRCHRAAHGIFSSAADREASR